MELSAPASEVLDDLVDRGVVTEVDLAETVAELEGIHSAVDTFDDIDVAHVVGDDVRVVLHTPVDG